MEQTQQTKMSLTRATATVDCPKSMVGRVIGKSGETIKALQTYTGALIQVGVSGQKQQQKGGEVPSSLPQALPGACARAPGGHLSG